MLQITLFDIRKRETNIIHNYIKEILYYIFFYVYVFVDIEFYSKYCKYGVKKSKSNLYN